MAEMTAEAFSARRAQDWQRLAALCEGQRALTGADERSVAALYRTALADLAQLRTLCAREHGPGHRPGEPEILTWLNAVVGRAHALIYASRRRGRLDVRRFFGGEVPAAIRRAMPRIGLSALIMVGGGAVAYLLCRNDVALARVLAGPALTLNAEAFSELGRGRDESTDAVMAAFYVTNNVQVSFIAFALGITFGLGTLWVMLQNGVTLGVTLALVRHYGSTDSFFAFLSSHGPIELFAIVLAAGAGLGMGLSLVAPGPHTRAVALKLAAGESAKLVMATACLLVIAAFFEAFVSPSALPPRVKHLIGAANALWLTLYVVGAGRSPGRRGRQVM
jgi:uncharacterized membrane protein SpoIIM required for sporulation